MPVCKCCGWTTIPRCSSRRWARWPTPTRTQRASGRIDEAEAAARRARIAKAADYPALADVDLVIEAVYENLELKQKIFRELDGIVKAAGILASNTSALDIDAIAAVTKRPEQVVGLHFFSPAHIMKLLEIVRGARRRQQCSRLPRPSAWAWSA